MPISEDRADKMEAKIDSLIMAVNRLAIIDERQIESGKRVGLLEDRVSKLESRLDSKTEALKLDLENVDRKLSTWIQRGTGAWAVVTTLFILYQTFGSRLG